MARRRFNETKLTSFQARYGEEVNNIANPTNGFCERVLGRVSVRAFETNPLDPGMIQKLVSVAQSAPSSSMAQAWSVILVEPGETRNKLKELLPDHALRNIEMMDSAPVLLIWLADLSRISAMGIDVGDSEFSIMSIIDATIAAQTLSLCAESFGLGVCYCGSFRTTTIFKTRKILKLPKNNMVIFGMFIGKPKFDPLQIKGNDGRSWVTPRLPQNTVLHHNEYTEAPLADLERYDQIVMDFYNQPHVVACNKEPNLSMTWSASLQRRSSKMLNSILDRVRQLGFFLR